MYIGKVHLALGGRIKVLMDYEIQAKTKVDPIVKTNFQLI